MNTSELRKAWKELTQAIREPWAMRPGSVCTQHAKTRRKDGSAHEKKPYTIYTRKQKGKTITRMLAQSQAPAYREAVGRFHDFLEIVEQLKAVGLALAEAQMPDQKKTPADGRRGKKRGNPADHRASGRRAQG